MSSLRALFRGSSSSNTPSKVSSKTQIFAAAATSPVPPGSNNGGGSGSGDDGSSMAQAFQQELLDIQDAMDAAGLIMDDDIEGAESRLRRHADSSTFHKLGLAVAVFLKSVLSFEKETMNEAATELTECEGRAWNDMKKAEKEAAKMARGSARGGGAYGARGNVSGGGSDRISKIYPPGSEFALAHAEAELMNAIVSVMHESLTDGLRGFYKLRKAYITLNGIMESELQYLKALRAGDDDASKGSVKNQTVSDEKMPGSFESSESTSIVEEEGYDVIAAEKPDGDENGNGFVSVDAAIVPPSQTSDVHVSGASVAPKDDPDASPVPATPLTSSDSDGVNLQGPPTLLDELHGVGTDTSLFESSVDVFIHSGANMCFGILLMMISMVPPAFSRLLSVVGFKGDRERGVRMLWQSTKFANVNGAIAGLFLLAYYNGLLGSADILPSDADREAEAASSSDEGEIVGYPRERCAALLRSMRARYPHSRLWKLEEARLLANNRRLDEAVRVLAANSAEDAAGSVGGMRQVTALNAFELSINAMFGGEWALARENFLRCVELSDWSHAIYFYQMACAETEMYRDAYHRAAALTLSSSAEEAADEGREQARAAAEKEAREYKALAEEHFRKVPTAAAAGRRRLMARQMPLEVFVCRKVQRLEERAKSLGAGTSLVDCIGVSPAMEMVYIWNGFKRMAPPLLENAHGYLAWDRCTAITADAQEQLRREKDEVAIRDVIDAAVLRSLGRGDDARAALESVLKLDRSVFKGPTKDDYVLPAAHYEVAAVAWIEACDPKCWPSEKESDAETAKFRQRKTDECQSWLDKVVKWETFVLDARFGMRVQTGLCTIRWLKAKKGWP